MNTCLVSSTHSHTILVFHPQQGLGERRGEKRQEDDSSFNDTFQLTQSAAVLLQSACSCGFLFSHDLSDSNTHFSQSHLGIIMGCTQAKTSYPF